MFCSIDVIRNKKEDVEDHRDPAGLEVVWELLSADGEAATVSVGAADRKACLAFLKAPDLLERTIRGFPWPKSMRWGAASSDPGALRWVRPLQSIVCTLGPETEDPDVIAFEVDGIQAGDITYGVDLDPYKEGFVIV